MSFIRRAPFIGLAVSAGLAALLLGLVAYVAVAQAATMGHGSAPPS